MSYFPGRCFKESARRCEASCQRGEFINHGGNLWIIDQSLNFCYISGLNCSFLFGFLFEFLYFTCKCTETDLPPHFLQGCGVTMWFLRPTVCPVEFNSVDQCQKYILKHQNVSHHTKEVELKERRRANFTVCKIYKDIIIENIPLLFFFYPPAPAPISSPFLLSAHRGRLSSTFQGPS